MGSNTITEKSKGNKKGTRQGNGSGYFVRLSDEKWRLRQQFGFKSNGRARILTVTGKTKAECRKKMKEKMEDPKYTVSGQNLAGETVGRLCRRHLEHDMAQREYLKPTAADRRECTIKNQIENYAFSRLQAASVKPQDVQNHIECLINENRLSASSIQKAYDVINAAYTWAISQGTLQNNPCVPIRNAIVSRLHGLSAKTAQSQDVIILSDTDVKNLYIEALKKKPDGTFIHPIGPFVLFLLETGLRVGELCALKWGDVYSRSGFSYILIKGTRHHIKIREGESKGYKVEEGLVKNAHARTIQLSAKAAELLGLIRDAAECCDADQYIYRNRRGNASNPSNFGSLVNKLYAAAKLPPTITGAHVLRKTFATSLYQQGVPIKDIASYIGDLESTTSRHYIAVRRTVRAGDQILSMVPFPVKK